MKNFEYYGLFLTEESKTKLKAWLWENGYDFDNDIIKGTLPCDWYLDHCTLLHKSHKVSETNLELKDYLDNAIYQFVNVIETLEINGIGVSDKAVAFRCNLSNKLCTNKIPHITICTFNGGKPVDSNNITEWKDIEPIRVEVKLKRVETQ